MGSQGGVLCTEQFSAAVAGDLASSPPRAREEPSVMTRHFRVCMFAIVCVALLAIAGCGTTSLSGGRPTVIRPTIIITPYPVLTQYTAVSVGSLHACALDASGNAYCWGANTHGELGNGTVGDSNRPSKVSGGIQFYQISAGSNHTCAVTRDGMVYCWGLEDYGEVGNNQKGGSQLTPTLVAVQNANDPYVAVSAGGHDSCAVTRNGNALCWGASWLGELGIGSQIGAYGGMPSDMNESVAAPRNASALPFVTTLTALSAGRQHTCGIVDFAAGLLNPVYCWGDNLDSEVSPTASGTCPTTGAPSTFPCSVSPE